MNIKNRISKLEKSANIGGKFCLCYGLNLKYEVIPISIEEWKRRVIAREPTEERLPDVCPDCGKDVDKRSIEKSFEEFTETIAQRVAYVDRRIKNHGYL